MIEWLGVMASSSLATAHGSAQTNPLLGCSGDDRKVTDRDRMGYTLSSIHWRPHIGCRRKIIPALSGHTAIIFYVPVSIFHQVGSRSGNNGPRDGR